MSLRHRASSGFTIVELLIVIVVIAVLASVSVVAYTGIQNRAYNSAVESDLANAAKMLEMARVELGHYPQHATDFPDGFTFTKSAYVTGTEDNNVYYITDTINDTYALGVQSRAGDGNGYILTSTDGLEKGYNRVWGSTTAGAIGVEWFDEGTFGITGYDVSAGEGWREVWSWTAP